MKAAKNLENPLTALPGVLLLVIFALIFVGCEVDMQVSVDGKVPPTFTLNGSGNLTFFSVSEISLENQKLAPAQRHSKRDRVLWEIWPSDKGYEETSIKKLPQITYGIIPHGFIQKQPDGGDPPKLVEGKIYEAGGPASNANGGVVWFTIRNGKSVQIKEPTGP